MLLIDDCDGHVVQIHLKCPKTADKNCKASSASILTVIKTVENAVRCTVSKPSEWTNAERTVLELIVDLELHLVG